MNRIPVIHAALFAVMIFAASATAFSAQESTPATELVQHVIKAAGGEEKLLKRMALSSSWGRATSLLAGAEFC